jgi:hypothetical protein
MLFKYYLDNFKVHKNMLFPSILSYFLQKILQNQYKMKELWVQYHVKV